MDISMDAGVDRISELPEPVLHHILSFLSQKQAFQTSALSKSRRRVGPTRPKLEFTERLFGGSYILNKEKFMSILDNTLQTYNRRNLSVQEFVFEMRGCHPKWFPLIDELIPMLLNNMGVEKFDFAAPLYVVDTSVVFRAELLTELYLSNCKLMTTTTTTTTTTTDHHGMLFSNERLKNLSLKKVEIEEATLEKIIRGCPLVERLILCGGTGPKTVPLRGGTIAIPSVVFQAEFLTELHLFGCKLQNNNGDDNNKLKRLKTLSLEMVCIEKSETIQKIVRRCPLVERVCLSDCMGLTTVQLSESHNSNIKHFSCSFCPSGYRRNSIGIDVPTIETLRIANCTNWYSHNKYYFPRLKILRLWRVRLSAELLNSLSSDVHSLEQLELKRCSGFQEIKLTFSSIKRLVITMASTKAIKTTIYAPNINYFEFSGHFPLQLIFHTETGREWESHVAMLFYNRSNKIALPWLLQLSQMLNALSQSRISLDVSAGPFKNTKVEDTNDGRFYKPVAVEHVRFTGLEYCGPYSSYPDFLGCLFFICRPRNIVTGCQTIRTPPNRWEREINHLAEFIISKIILKQGKMSLVYLWERDLMEISMQVWDNNRTEWRPVEGTNFLELTINPRSFLEFKATGPKIRFRLKWRERAYQLKLGLVLVSS